MVLSALLLIPAAALGIAAAGRSAPLAFGWPSEHAAMLKQRLRMLVLDLPSRSRRVLAGCGLCLVISSAALMAYAAQPSAPEALSAEAAGVIGSGDQLSLKLSGPAGRTLSLGQEYRDGWVLQALTPDTAVLARNGEMRRVGLNPSGETADNRALANDSQVAVLAASTGRGAGQAPPGATKVATAAKPPVVQDAARIAATGQRVEAAISEAMRNARARGVDAVNLSDLRTGIGKDDFDAYIAARSPDQARADALALNDSNSVKAMDGQVIDGPATIYVAAGQSKAVAVQQSGLLGLSGYRMGPLQPDGSAILYRNGPGGASTVPAQ